MRGHRARRLARRRAPIIVSSSRAVLYACGGADFAAGRPPRGAGHAPAAECRARPELIPLGGDNEAARACPWRQTCRLAQDVGEDPTGREARPGPITRPRRSTTPQRSARFGASSAGTSSARRRSWRCSPHWSSWPLPTGVAPGARWPLVLAFAALGALAAASMRAGAAAWKTRWRWPVIAVDRGDRAGRDAARLGHRRAGPRLLRPDDLHGRARWPAAPGRAGGGAQRAGGAEPGLCAASPWLPAGNAALSRESLGLRTLIHLIVIGARPGRRAAGLARGRAATCAPPRSASSAFAACWRMAADAYWEIDDRVPPGRAATRQAPNAAARCATTAPRPGALGAAAVRLSTPTRWTLLQADLERARALPRPAGAAGCGAPGSVRALPGQRRAALRRARRLPRLLGRGARRHRRRAGARRRWRPPRRATRTCSTRIPTPLVLHRDGRVLDANPAALALFGYADLQAMVGQRPAGAATKAATRASARAARIEALQQLPPAQALPVADFRLHGARRAAHRVRATGVRVDAEGGPAMLSIFVDDTERRPPRTRCAAPRPCCRTWWPPAPT